MTIHIEESGVVFGEFLPENVFEIEKARSVSQLGDGIKKVEFILHQAEENRVIFLEAKSSYPREAEKFLTDIQQKMTHSLIIWFTAIVGRHDEIKTEIGEQLKRVRQLKRNIHLILVVPNMPSEHCVIASDKLRKALNVERRLWNIRECDIRVLNTEKAKRMGLVDYAHSSNVSCSVE